MIGCRIIGNFTLLALLSSDWPAQVGPVVTVQLLLYYAPLLTLVTNLCLANHYWISHESSNTFDFPVHTGSAHTHVSRAPGRTSLPSPVARLSN